MVGCVARLMGRAQRGSAYVSNDETARSLHARAIAESLARALDLGHRVHVAHLVAAASPVLASDTSLAELVVRAHLDSDDIEAAVVSIAAASVLTPTLRRLRIIAWQRLGRRSRARRELRRWARERNAPMDIGCRLALAEWEAGDEHAAKGALLRNLARAEDPATLELIILLSMAQTRDEPARAWSERWEEAAIASPRYRTLMLETLGLAAWSASSPPTEARVAHLAEELREHESIISTLVEAQRRQPDLAVNRLLDAALARILGSLRRPRVALEALAHLARLRGDAAAAAGWVDTGLAQFPNAVGLLTLRERLIDETLNNLTTRVSRTQERAA